MNKSYWEKLGNPDIFILTDSLDCQLGTAKESHEQARLCMVETDRDLQELIEEHKRAIESTNSELGKRPL